MTAVVLTAWAVLAVVMAGLWYRQLATRNATSVDAAWSGGLALLALTYPWFVDGDPARRALVAALGAAWGGRLAWYLMTERVLGHAEEDGRYRALRVHWGERAPSRFFLVYQAQAAVAVLFSLPMLAAMEASPPGALAAAGILVWGIAVAGEAIADHFEWIHWWAYVLIGAGSPLTWIGPVLMLVFLFRVSGIPYTELQALKSRGERYRDYQRSTSTFVPWFPSAAAGAAQVRARSASRNP